MQHCTICGCRFHPTASDEHCDECHNLSHYERRMLEAITNIAQSLVTIAASLEDIEGHGMTLPTHSVYTTDGLVIPLSTLEKVPCRCGHGWSAHNPLPQGTTTYHRYCLECACLGFMPVLEALLPEEGT